MNWQAKIWQWRQDSSTDEQQVLAIIKKKLKKKKQWFEKKLVSREPKLVSVAQPKEPCEGIYTYTYKYAYTYTYISTHT